MFHSFFLFLMGKSPFFIGKSWKITIFHGKITIFTGKTLETPTPTLPQAPPRPRVQRIQRHRRVRHQRHEAVGLGQRRGQRRQRRAAALDLRQAWRQGKIMLTQQIMNMAMVTI